MPPRYRRLDRVNSLLQKEISDILRSELKDPRIGFVSVIGVDTSPGLRYAKVRVSVMGTGEEKKKSLDALSRASGFIRDLLLHRLDIKRIPQLEFILDENIEYSIHISQVLDSLNRPENDSDE